MKMADGIAAVTGGSGMVGRKITQKLLQAGYEVSILTINKSFSNESAHVYYCDIEDTDTLRPFLNNVSYLFHCAADFRDESKMWDINVSGTEKILNLISTLHITYLCYLSSVGIIGLTCNHFVDERNTCNPQNAYEKSKWAAEQLVAKKIGNCCTVMLRPTNVIDEQRPGVLTLPIRSNWHDRFMVFLKGGECAHIVHAEDVADAAIFFMNAHFEKPECYIVSCDHDRFNTVGGLWALYKAMQLDHVVEGVDSVIHLPIIIPHILRRLSRGTGNYGNICYSSEKLLSTGFRYCLGVEGAVGRIAASQCTKSS